VEGFDYLHWISEGYTQIRRYASAFLDAFRFKAAPAAQPILDAIETLKRMDADGLRRLPADSPTDFVRTCATEKERGLKRQEEVDRAGLSSIFSQ
jgi:hypothetical protein